jgi:DNA topoisomerase-1
MLLVKRSATGSDFTAKEFRTWGGTVMAAKLFRACDIAAGASERECTRQVNAVLKQVAAGLGNTLAVCRQQYVHPAVVEAFRSGTLNGCSTDEAAQRQQDDPYALDGDETTVLKILHAVQRKQ